MYGKRTMKLVDIVLRRRAGTRSQRLMPIILATWESEIRMLVFQRQPEQRVHKTLS
jgi:hypothetical protein